jgi:hypothetical protein
MCVSSTSWTLAIRPCCACGRSESGGIGRWGIDFAPTRLPLASLIGQAGVFWRFAIRRRKLAISRAASWRPLVAKNNYNKNNYLISSVHGSTISRPARLDRLNRAESSSIGLRAYELATNIRVAYTYVYAMLSGGNQCSAQPRYL